MKNGSKRTKKGPFSDKDLQLGSYDGFLQLLSISQQFSINIFLKYIHRPTNRGIICVFLTDNHGSSSNWKMSAPDKKYLKNCVFGPFFTEMRQNFTQNAFQGFFSRQICVLWYIMLNFPESLAKFRFRSLYFSRIKNLCTKRHKNTEI